MTVDKLHPYLSIIVPMLNEAEQLPGLLEHLLLWQRKGCQVILVDGGSTDNSAELASVIGFRVITAPPGRAQQMNAGARAVDGETLLFLHADSRLPENADVRIRHALTGGIYANEISAEAEPQWGRFDVSIVGSPFVLKIVSWLMNQRSRISAIATGDQAIFVNARTFQRVGCFPQQPLMEDIELCKALRQITPPACLKEKVTTSGRRWESKGVWATILLMWRLRFAYWRGTPAATLAKLYR